MPAIGRFEDIDAWKKARTLTREVYRVTSAGEFAKDFSLKDQIRRASVSIMSNIAEGFERGGNKEFRQFLSHAKGSAAEVRSHLVVALDAGFLTREQFNALYRVADECGRLIGGFMRYLASSALKGNKFQ